MAEPGCPLKMDLFDEETGKVAAHWIVREKDRDSQRKATLLRTLFSKWEKKDQGSDDPNQSVATAVDLYHNTFDIKPKDPESAKKLNGMSVEEMPNCLFVPFSEISSVLHGELHEHQNSKGLCSISAVKSAFERYENKRTENALQAAYAFSDDEKDDMSPAPVYASVRMRRTRNSEPSDQGSKRQRILCTVCSTLTEDPGATFCENPKCCLDLRRTGTIVRM